MAKTTMTYNRSIGATESGWRSTSIKVEAGDTIVFQNATGSMQPWGGGPTYTPIGDTNITPWQYSLLPTARFCALVGQIRTLDMQTQYFEIGLGSNIVANISGEIYLGINDGVSWEDNLGPGYSVTITVPQEEFLLIPPSRPLGILPYDTFHLVRDYATHQATQTQWGVDYVVYPDLQNFDTGNYVDPLTRTSDKLRSRRVYSLTHGIIIDTIREQLTVGTNNANPIFPGEDFGITIEVLTWYPYTSSTPSSYYLIQYTHVFPSFGSWIGGLTFPSVENQIANNSVNSVRSNNYTQLGTLRNSNVVYGTIINTGDELGAYAMIGLSSVGPHLHISLARYDSSNGNLPQLVNGRPSFGSGTNFANWLQNPFATTQFDPELYIPGATMG